MNFTNLYKRIKSLDEAAPSASICNTCESQIAECGDKGPADVANTQDAVTMNVSMTGNGETGIRNLLNIIRTLEQGEASSDLASVADVVFDTDEVVGEEFANLAPDSSGPTEFGIDTVLNPPGTTPGTARNEPPKVNGGGNPLAEALTAKLYARYREIKEGS